MQVFRGISSLPAGLKGSVLTIGNFDGVHIGHQGLIDEAVQKGKKWGFPSVLLTFDPHPAAVLSGRSDYVPLFDREDLVARAQNLGIQILIIQNFTMKYSQRSADEFLNDIVSYLRPREIVIGHDFVFGHNREGSIESLGRAGPVRGFDITVIAPITIDGQVVSSSKIRDALKQGELELAAGFLGRNYTVHGTKVRGKGRGKALRYPTANLIVPQASLLKRGVYVTRTVYGGKVYPSVTNVGFAPTFTNGQSTQPVIETHILDQNLEIEDSEVRVDFLSYVREERKFASPEDLAHQIGKDVERAKAFFKNQN